MRKRIYLVFFAIFFFMCFCKGKEPRKEDVKEIDVQDVLDIEMEIDKIIPDADAIIEDEEISEIDGDFIDIDAKEEKKEVEIEEIDEIEVFEKNELTNDVEVEVEEEVIQPLCPCDESIEAFVCGTDYKTYKNDVCAMCAICKNCVNCKGDKICSFENTDDWVKWKGKCEDCFASCTKEEFECGVFCGFKGPKESEKYKKGEEYEVKTYDDCCDMKCSEEWKSTLFPLPKPESPLCWNEQSGWCEYILYYDECKVTCKGCEDQPYDPFCGTDWETYPNKCCLLKDPKTPGVKIKCPGACIKDCPECDAIPCKPVCGMIKKKKDILLKTYNNKCYAECKGSSIAYEKQCCFACPLEEEEVCGYDGNELVTFPGKCPIQVCFPEFEILYKGKCDCPCYMKEEKVCGVDNKTYTNECWAICKAGGKKYDGECKKCPECPTIFNPVCGSVGNKQNQTYANECFLVCEGAKKKLDTVCDDCKELCGTPENPKQPKEEVCGEDGVTYPNECFPIKCTLVPVKTKGACP